MSALITAFLISALDQWSKHKIRAGFNVNEPVEIIDGFFNLTYVRNTGAVWGILQGYGFILVLFSIGVMLVTLFFYNYIVRQNKWYALSLGLMTGGITGNLIDRIRVGWVTDFLDFHVYGMHWPAFNVADAAICCGAFLYALLSFITRPDTAPEPDESK